MQEGTEFQELPLRQRKFAQTKLGLLEAALTALESRSLEEVSVRELCEAVEISEASFFNYFPRKTDLLVYYVQLWSLEMAWHGERLGREKGGLAAIEAMYGLTGRRIDERPGPMGEIVAWQARMTAPPEFGEVTIAERLLAFPEMDGVEAVEGEGLGTLLPPLLEQAVEAGELPRDLDRREAVLALAAVFFGTPVAMRRMEPGGVEGAYRAQLRILWTGLRGR